MLAFKQRFNGIYVDLRRVKFKIQPDEGCYGKENF